MKGGTNLDISCEIQVQHDNNNISMKENDNNDFVFGKNDLDSKIPTSRKVFDSGSGK